jgi:beta-glucosidase
VDVPVPDAIPVDGVVSYDEGVHVGYRSWDLSDRTPAAPFGHGLGWTTWTYDEATATCTDDGGAELTVAVTNTGPRDGREVVQAYLEPPAGTPHGDRPVRWLAGFTVAHARPGATTVARIRIAPEALRVWDTTRGGWVTPAGTYRIRVGRSSRDLRLTAELHVPPTEHQPHDQHHPQ